MDTYEGLGAALKGSPSIHTCTRLAKVSAKCKDMFKWKSDEASYEGYVGTPGNELGCDGDVVEFDYCLDCGKIQHTFPVAGSYPKED